MFLTWFKSKKEVFLILIMKALRLFFDEIVDDLYEVVKRHVARAEKSGEAGNMKYKLAFDGIVQELGDTDYPNYLVNLLIEVAVILMKEQEHK